MLDHPHIKESLTHYARTKDPILQKVVVKVIFCTLEYKELKLVIIFWFEIESSVETDFQLLFLNWFIG